ncbi:unnamed protein product (plasmid) [Mycetohabitans rhizoxinica HKI 454]|uniref:Uncharacterized protein n=1 Tax=Mycetohabitans rhizoxinica (strain DSM 19002 / CIP 109453 / HKI 454) TaxID=882378 RepID=E5AUB1_MYCRK|nr:unnamed protein product [Mycetohabitans rhizoxinica HKI 454]
MSRACLHRSGLPRRSSAPGCRACATKMTVVCIQHDAGIRALASQSRYGYCVCPPCLTRRVEPWRPDWRLKAKGWRAPCGLRGAELPPVLFHFPDDVVFPQSGTTKVGR